MHRCDFELCVCPRGIGLRKVYGHLDDNYNPSILKLKMMLPIYFNLVQSRFDF